MSDDYTKEIRERLEKADGPYHIGHINEEVDRADVESAEGFLVADDSHYWRFLVHAPTDIANLLAEREVLRETLKHTQSAMHCNNKWYKFVTNALAWKPKEK